MFDERNFSKLITGNLPHLTIKISTILHSGKI